MKKQNLLTTLIIFVGIQISSYVFANSHVSAALQESLKTACEQAISRNEQSTIRNEDREKVCNCVASEMFRISNEQVNPSDGIELMNWAIRYYSETDSDQINQMSRGRKNLTFRQIVFDNAILCSRNN